MSRKSSTQKSRKIARFARIAASLLIVLTFMGFGPAPNPAQAQSPRIVASVDGDWFWTTEFMGGVDLAIAIFESQDTGLPPLWQGSKTTDEWGFVQVLFEDTGVDLQPGNYLVVSDGAATKGLLLETITMQVFDNFQEVIAGTAPLGRAVWVFAGTQDGQTSMQVWADTGSGVWTADFNSLPFDITEEMRPWSFAHIYDDDMDANEANSPGLPGVWREEFDGEALPEPWYWINENADKWNLTEQPGFLRIYTSPYTTGSENLLLRSPDLDYFVIQTHLSFEPVSDFQIAGLVIWQDADNFLQFGRAFCDIPDVCVGNGIYFDHLVGAAGSGGNFATVIGSASEVDLRLEFRGSEVAAFYAEDGIHWSPAGAHTLPEGFVANGVGLTSAQNFFQPESPSPAGFDYFALAPLAEG